MTLLSNYLCLGFKLDEYGVFDPIIEKDSNFYINIQRLKKTDVPEFIGSYQKIHDFFRAMIKLLNKASKPSVTDFFFKVALDRFHFPEVNGIRLGNSKTGRGAGFGTITESQVVQSAYDIVKAGIDDPEFFELLPLFQENVGADRLSDMIANLIYNDIFSYTKRVYAQFNIDQTHYPTLVFNNKGLLEINNNPVLLVPLQIIHRLPVAECWSDIDVVMSENSAIRSEINALIAAEWAQYTNSEKKNCLRKEVFQDPNVFSRVVEKYRTEQLDQISIKTDSEYCLEKILQYVFSNNSTWESHKLLNKSLDLTIDFFKLFARWIENNGGWEVVQHLPNGNKEKMLQRIIHGFALSYIASNNLDMSCEPNEGVGPCDFKFSIGKDITVSELKLSSNSQYKHGFVEQLPLYAKSECTDNMVYILIDVGHPGKIEAIKALHDRMMDEKQISPELIVIDAKEKSSASKKAIIYG